MHQHNYEERCTKAVLFLSLLNLTRQNKTRSDKFYEWPHPRLQILPDFLTLDNSENKYGGIKDTSNFHSWSTYTYETSISMKNITWCRCLKLKRLRKAK